MCRMFWRHLKNLWHTLRRSKVQCWETYTLSDCRVRGWSIKLGASGAGLLGCYLEQSDQFRSATVTSEEGVSKRKTQEKQKKRRNLEQPEVSYLEVSWSSNNSTKAEDWCFLDGFRNRTPSPPRNESLSITNAKETNYLARLFQYSDSFFILVWLYIARYYWLADVLFHTRSTAHQRYRSLARSYVRSIGWEID